MKPSLFLTLTLLLLNACAPQSDKNNPPKDPPVRRFEVVDGYSGTVTLNMGAAENGVLELPPQVSIKFEKMNPTYEHLRMKSFPLEQKRFLGSQSQEIVRVGCEEIASDEFLQGRIEADVIEFCGFIFLPLKPLIFKANQIIFNNTNLSTASDNLSPEELVKVQMASLIFQAKTVVLIGDNSLTAQGGANYKIRNTAPRVLFNTGNFSGSGHLEIRSVKSFKTVEL